MDQFNDRYNRQLILKGFGPKAQQSLALARVLIVGAGGLGCPALLYLTAAGVGTIGIVDHDEISLSNLHRQVLYTTEEIGLLKVEVATKKLMALNPSVTINPYPFQLDNINAVDLLSQYDFIIDGTDNFSSRYLINDVCTFLKKPLVHGAVAEYEGQVAIFNAGNPDEVVNYRDLFPVQPADDEFRNCAEAGVLGVLPGIIGTMQATELIKLVTGIGEPLVNKLLTYNSLTQDFYKVELVPLAPGSYRIPVDAAEFQHLNYGSACAAPIHTEEISPEETKQLIANGNAILIDVRETGETPAPEGIPYIQIPLSVFPVFAEGIEGDPVILFCQQGGRSKRAAAMLREVSVSGRKIFSLQGGVESLFSKPTRQHI
ncbi:MAG: HesA/MoeB/ThiF family protein [Chitinophagaceae bacterium]